jgi:DNA mismatch repair protein MutS2
MGEVGASSAVEIARRVGIPEDVCARARQILGGGASVVSEAVTKLENERAASARSRLELEQAKAELQREREAIARERAEMRAGARAELIADYAQKRAEVAALIAQLQVAPTMAQAVEAQRAIERAAVREEEKVQEAVPEQAEIVEGSRVKHVRLGTEGVVVELHDGHATVQMGALKSKVSLEDLVPISRKVASAQFRKSPKERLEKAEQARAAPVEIRVPRVDLRGMRVDEALRAVDLELDRCLRAGEETLHVLHGHGSGALKAAVREHLQRSPYVKRARPAEQHEGGDGVTVAELTG